MVVIHRVSKSPKAGKDHEHSEIRQGHHGTVTGQRLYQLVRQPEPTADRHFEIEFLDSGAEAYYFTSG